MLPLKIKENKSYLKQRACYICEKEIISDDNGNENAFKSYYNVRYHYLYTRKYEDVSHNICNLRYIASKELPVVFHDVSKNDCHFIVKEMAEEFEGQFECLVENTEKYKTFSVPIKKT